MNVRSSILGEGGRAKEAQAEFLTLVEDAIRQPDLAQSVQRYQLVVDEAKVRLNLAVCPGAWLMPARMIINTESTIGYNNRLKQAIPGMKLGVNNAINPGTKKAGLQLMEGGPSKINPPNSHPSNRIHKAVTEAQDPRPPPKKTKNSPSDEVGEIEETFKEPQHETNKTTVTVGMVAVAALLITLGGDHLRFLRYFSATNAISPISPGSREPSFAPICFRPALIAWPLAFKALVTALTTAPIVTPAAKMTAVSVTRVF